MWRTDCHRFLYTGRRASLGRREDKEASMQVIALSSPARRITSHVRNR